MTAKSVRADQPHFCGSKLVLKTVKERTRRTSRLRWSAIHCFAERPRLPLTAEAFSRKWLTREVRA